MLVPSSRFVNANRLHYIGYGPQHVLHGKHVKLKKVYLEGEPHLIGSSLGILIIIVCLCWTSLEALRTARKLLVVQYHFYASSKFRFQIIWPVRVVTQFW